MTKTIQFNSHRDVGDPIKSSKIYNDQCADELIFLNINRQKQGIQPLLEILEAVSEECFMPLAVGGGISEFEMARQLIQNGADKVVVNSVSYSDIKTVSRICENLGSQAVIAAVDVRYENGAWSLWSDCGRVKELVTLNDHLNCLSGAGVGEIMINSIDRDGTMSGYDIPLLAYVVSRVSVPVIGCGGAGTYEHMRDAFMNTGVDALACGSIFNFGDNNPLRAKAYLSNHGIPFKVV